MGLLINPYRFAVAAGGGGSYYDEVMADSPLAYFRLNETPGLVSAATASSNFSSEPPGNAFDGNAGTYWTTNGSSTGWLRAQMSPAVALTTYAIRRRDDIPARNPKDWTFEGSNDGTTWTILDTQTGVTWPTAGESRRYTFTNATAYLYYRINVTANNGDTYLSVAELNVAGLAVDSSGAGHDGTIAGSTSTSPTSGLVPGDGALSFAGGAGVTVPAASWLNAATFTVEAWFKLNGVSGTQAIVSHYSAGGASADARWEIRADGATLRFYAFESSFASLDIGTVAADAAYCVAVTVSGTTVTPYLNAVAGTPATLAMNAAGAHPLTIAQAGVNERLTGVVDEVAFYGAALSAARIGAHYAAA